jgi:signal transduction histidine kinase
VDVKHPFLVGLAVFLFRISSGMAAGLIPSDALPSPSGLPLLTRVEQVRSLSVEECKRGYPVRLQGVITFYDYYEDIKFTTFFIQDETGGVFIHYPGPPQALRPGQRVEMEGRSGPGSFAPEIVDPSWRVLGDGELPPVRLTTAENLFSGKEDGQWVEVKCHVRSASVHRGRAEFEVTIGTSRFVVRVPDRVSDRTSLDAYVDCEVGIRGVCAPLYNSKRQLFNVRLLAPNLDCIVIEAPPLYTGFDSPRRPVNSLFQYTPQATYGHRVKVQGTVLLQQPGGALFIRDETQGLHVKTVQKAVFQPGDVVEALGFPALGEYTPLLEDAVLRKVGTAPVPAAIPTSVEQILSGDCDAELVQLDARLLEQVRRRNQHVLVLQSGDIIFNAEISEPAAGEGLALAPIGSLLRLSGVCVAELRENWRPPPGFKPQSFRLLLRSSADIVVLQRPPWWNPARVLWVLVAMTAVLLVVLGWLVALRRKVRQQTQVIHGKLQRETVLEERTRIARELHDSLEQGLAGIVIQLDAAAARLGETSPAARHCVEMARNMSRHSLNEARRSVWDLRSHLLEQYDLLAAFNEIVKPLAEGSSVRIQVRSSGPPRKLTARVENHLLRIGQEAVTNAVKHAQAARVELELTYEPCTVRLLVRDDGKGFDPNASLAISSGHFGLLDMRERAQKIGTQIQWQGAVGAGTEVRVEVPEKFAAPDMENS